MIKLNVIACEVRRQAKQNKKRIKKGILQAKEVAHRNNSMAYLARDGEATLGELHREIEHLRGVLVTETNGKAVLDVVLEKRKVFLNRLCSLIMPDAPNEAAREELLAILETDPVDLILEERIPLRPLWIAMANGSLKRTQSINMTNSQALRDDDCVLLGHLLCATDHLPNLQKLSFSGTRIRCRGIEALIKGLTARAQRHGSWSFSLMAVDTDRFDDDDEVQQKLMELVKLSNSKQFVCKV